MHRGLYQLLRQFPRASETRSIETECRHALEEYEKDLRAVQELEKNLVYRFAGCQGMKIGRERGNMVIMRK